MIVDSDTAQLADAAHPEDCACCGEGPPVPNPICCGPTCGGGFGTTVYFPGPNNCVQPVGPGGVGSIIASATISGNFSWLETNSDTGSVLYDSTVTINDSATSGSSTSNNCVLFSFAFPVLATRVRNQIGTGTCFPDVSTVSLGVGLFARYCSSADPTTSVASFSVPFGACGATWTPRIDRLKNGTSIFPSNGTIFPTTGSMSVAATGCTVIFTINVAVNGVQVRSAPLFRNGIVANGSCGIVVTIPLANCATNALA